MEIVKTFAGFGVPLEISPAGWTALLERLPCWTIER